MGRIFEKYGQRYLSRELREGRGAHLARRRGIVALSLAAAGSMGAILLYQMGLVRHLPGPLPGLASDRIDASPEAYGRLSTPDAALGLVSYSVTAGLASMGGRDRARRAPWVPAAMAAKVAFDAAQGARLIWQQATRFRGFCGFCLIAAAAGFAMVPLALPEGREAAREMWARRPRALERAPADVEEEAAGIC